MLLVLTIHTNVGVGEFNHEITADNPLYTCWRLIVLSLSYVAVNVYVLISGYFGIRIKKKTVLSLLFMIMFYKILIGVFGLTFNLSGCWEWNKIITFYKLLIPGASQWFVGSYLLLMLFSPMLNSWIKSATTKQLLFWLVIFYIVQTIAGWMFRTEGQFRWGYSFLSFAGLYVLGSFLARLTKMNKLKGSFGLYFTGYVLVRVFSAIVVFAILYLINNNVIVKGIFDYRFLSYDSPLLVAGAVLLFLAFSKLQFSNRWVNNVAVSTFAVYLIHCNPFIQMYYVRISKLILTDYSPLTSGFMYMALILMTFIGCILFDRIRIICWDGVNRLLDSKA